MVCPVMLVNISVEGLVTRKLIQSRTEAQLSAENPFSWRMEAPGQLPGN